MAATRAQKIRLSVFMLVSSFIVLATLFYLVGSSMVQIRDEYLVILDGSSGGLETGSQVRFNDILVGRVESVKLAPDDPSKVHVRISLEHGTPVTEDTIATPQMAGITGSKRLSMHGGTKTSKLLKPGDTIASANDDLSMMMTKVVNIADKLEDLVDNLVEVTNTKNLDNISNVIAEVDSITKNVNRIITTNEANINGIVGDARQLITKLDTSMAKVDSTLSSLERTVNTVGSPTNVKKIGTILDSVNALAANATARTSDEELGQTIQSVNR
ncbi:MAG: MCE family protein, partial [Proteobacteria bacterium]|nr:MCE family protein [Pseudomonadota bacterium]